MTDREKFIDAVMSIMPEQVCGLRPYRVGKAEDSGPVVIAVYFLRAFDADGKPLAQQPELDAKAPGWQQAAIYVTASEREIALRAADIDKLAADRMASALCIPPIDSFFAEAA